MLQVPPLVDPVRNASKQRTPPTIEGVLPVSPYPIVHPRRLEENAGEQRQAHPPPSGTGRRRPQPGRPAGDTHARSDDHTDDEAPAAPRDRPSLGIDEYA